MKLLQKVGVENIDVVTLVADSTNPGCNRGFAFLELETYRDAQIAYRKLSKKDVFGKGLNIRVDWAEPLNGPDEKQMQKVSHTHKFCVSEKDKTKTAKSELIPFESLSPCGSFLIICLIYGYHNQSHSCQLLFLCVQNSLNIMYHISI